MVNETPTPKHSQAKEESLIGKEVRIFADEFDPEVIGVIEVSRGYGSLRLIEVRVKSKIQVVSEGKWELLEGGES